MTLLEQLPPGQRLVVAAIVLALMVAGAVLLLRGVDLAIDVVVDAWGGWLRRRDARARNPRAVR